MDIVQHLLNNHDQLFYLISGLSFVLELAVMGLGGPLLFFAIASAITGLLIQLGVISGWEVEIFVVGILTGIIAVALWKPLKRFQNSGGGADNSSDMIGREVKTSSEITNTEGTIRYSGINWSARLDRDSDVEKIISGALCVITAVDGNVMIVKPFDN